MTTIATIISTYPDLGEMATFSLMGFGVVCFVLIALSMLTTLVGSFFKRLQAASQK